MGAVPAVLSPAATLDEAARTMQEAGVSALPVCRNGSLDGDFLGVVTALDLALAADVSPTAPTLATLPLAHVSVPADSLPSQVLTRLSAGGPEGVPVLNEAGRVVGWISRSDLVAKVRQAQLRALEQGKQSSWGSRYLDRKRSRR